MIINGYEIAEDPLSGDRLEMGQGTIFVRDFLGNGRYGMVVLAKNLRDGSEVAVKVMNKGLILQTKLDVQKEIDIMRSLDHHNVIKLFDVFVDDKNAYLVMEIARGGDLWGRVAQGVLDERTALKYFRQLLDVVGYCHKRGVVHRDLKLENLLLDVNDDMKICDFGLSSVFVEGQKLDETSGSRHYCAPEVWRALMGQPYEGPPVDIWSCGVILFAMLFGCYPFDVATTLADCYEYQQMVSSGGRYPWPQGHSVSGGPRDVIERIFITAPEQRATIPQLLQHPWITGQGMGVPHPMGQGVPLAAPVAASQPVPVPGAGPSTATGTSVPVQAVEMSTAEAIWGSGAARHGSTPQGTSSLSSGPGFPMVLGGESGFSSESTMEVVPGPTGGILVGDDFSSVEQFRSLSIEAIQASADRAPTKQAMPMFISCAAEAAAAMQGQGQVPGAPTGLVLDGDADTPLYRAVDLGPGSGLARDTEFMIMPEKERAAVREAVDALPPFRVPRVARCTAFIAKAPLAREQQLFTMLHETVSEAVRGLVRPRALPGKEAAKVTVDTHVEVDDTNHKVSVVSRTVASNATDADAVEQAVGDDLAVPLLALDAGIYRLGEGEEAQVIVDLKRKQGDIMLYQKAFRQVYETMAKREAVVAMYTPSFAKPKAENAGSKESAPVKA